MDNGNTAEIEVCGERIEVKASNRACEVYAEEFRPTAEAPFTGSLIGDIVAEHALIRQSGLTLPSWSDAPHVLGAVWAMARAAGSTRKGWGSFRDAVLDGTASAHECVAAISELMFDGGLGERTFFRQPGRGDGAVEPDTIAQG